MRSALDNTVNKRFSCCAGGTLATHPWINLLVTKLRKAKIRRRHCKPAQLSNAAREKAVLIRFVSEGVLERGFETEESPKIWLHLESRQDYSWRQECVCCYSLEQWLEFCFEIHVNQSYRKTTATLGFVNPYCSKIWQWRSYHQHRHRLGRGACRMKLPEIGDRWTSTMPTWLAHRGNPEGKTSKQPKWQDVHGPQTGWIFVDFSKPKEEPSQNPAATQWTTENWQWFGGSYGRKLLDNPGYKGKNPTRRHPEGVDPKPRSLNSLYHVPRSYVCWWRSKTEPLHPWWKRKTIISKRN